VTIAWSAHVSMLFGEVGVLDRPAAARAAGFRYVESWWPGDLAPAWAARVREAGVSVALLNADGGDLAAGERGYLNDVRRRDEALAAVDAALELGEEVGAGCINVLVGRELEGAPREGQLDAVADALGLIADRARDRGIAVVVEHINDLDAPGYLVPTPDEAAALIRRVGRPEVRLLYDAYHAARKGLDPVAAAVAAAPLIGHVQFADCPGRGAPGTGTSDLWSLVAALDRAGYTGAIGLEFDPAGPTSAALGFLERAPASAPFPG
jgi:hydroxypyruvate isomerase